MKYTAALVPDNKGRGAILKRLLRGAFLNYYLLSGNLEVPLNELVKAVAKPYKGTYLDKVMSDELEIFKKLITRAVPLMDKEIAKAEGGVLKGATAFNLQQTHGISIELQKRYLQTKGIQVDWDEFEKEKFKHQKVSRVWNKGLK